VGGLATGCGNARAPLVDRKDDLYETPEVAVQALLAVEAVPLTVWEPACGPGAIVRSLRASGRAVIATDLVDYDCPDSAARRDFLMEQRAPDGVPAIVTNPPFKLAQQFVEHARRLVPQTYMLMRLAFLEAERRRALFDGGDLARIYVFSRRLPMMHRAGWEGRKANSGMAFAWFCWDRSHSGAPTIHWVDWKDHIPQRNDDREGCAADIERVA
jgi:hypothetical protein